MNKYLNNLEKIEFVVTYACTGRCRHCSEGDHSSCGAHIDPTVAADAVRKIASVYGIKTVMTFGGEPLLYPETVYAVMTAASELNIPKRQIITNGYFTKDPERIREVVKKLAEAGVNDLRLSAAVSLPASCPATITFGSTSRVFQEKPFGAIRASIFWIISSL